MDKLAVVTFELVDESFAFSDGAVVEEMLGWFREVVAVPWVKEVKGLLLSVFEPFLSFLNVFFGVVGFFRRLVGLLGVLRGIL